MNKKIAQKVANHFKQKIMSEKTKTENKPFLIRLDPITKEKAKEQADKQNRSLNNFIVNAVKEVLAQS